MSSNRRSHVSLGLALFAAFILCVASSCTRSPEKPPVRPVAPEKKPPEQKPAAKATVKPGGTEGHLWQTDFEAARKKAKAEKRLLLVDFTGSDWCGWCMKLKGEVFDKQEFKTEAPKQFVLVELDYPRQKELPDELKKQNGELQKRYKIEGYPTILILDSEGEVIAKTGYRPGGPQEYVKHLGGLVDAYHDILKLRADLDKVRGLARAKLLDRLIDAYDKLENDAKELPVWSKEIVGIDADNKAGLRTKHEYRLLMTECATLKEEKKFSEIRAKVARILALPGLTGQQKQNAYFAESESFFLQRDIVGAVAGLEKALAADPASAEAAHIQSLIKQLKPLAVMVQLNADLKKAKGPERAKVLDQLVAAAEKVGQAGSTADADQSIEWSREIVSLDPENKLGLKAKHEFRVLIADAGKRFDERKFGESRAALEKALALPKLTDQQKQEVYVGLGRCCREEKDLKKSLEWLKKALDAAPHSEQAAEIERSIQSVEAEQKKGKA
jgi:thioredoxin-related protein